jgi:enoyl-CoA hydratase/carnithine racemase
MHTQVDKIRSRDMTVVQYSAITYEISGSAAIITLNRPKQMNSWTPAMATELRHAMAQAEDDKDAFGIVLTGAGKAFCAGADMGELQKLKAQGGFSKRDETDVSFDANPGAPETMPEGFGKGAYSYFATIRKPIIAAVNGAVAGVGLPCALFCDMRFFGESGYVSSSFAKRGLIAEAGTAWILPKLVGLDTAFDILWSSRRVYGKEAKELKLATRVYPDEDLLNETIAYINNLAENCSPASIAGMKGQLYRDLFRDPTESFKEAHRMTKATLKTSDFREGVQSFMEKRKPEFSGIGKAARG